MEKHAPFFPENKHYKPSVKFLKNTIFKKSDSLSTSYICES